MSIYSFNPNFFVHSAIQPVNQQKQKEDNATNKAKSYDCFNNNTIQKEVINYQVLLITFDEEDKKKILQVSLQVQSISFNSSIHKMKSRFIT